MKSQQDPTQFTQESAERIARVVRAAELAVPQARPLSFDRVDVQRKPKPEKVFTVCTFTGSWLINTAKVVTFKNVTTTPNTLSAINLVCSLAPTAQCDISVAKYGTAWYLVQPNYTQQPGYLASGTQVLSIINGSLAWSDVTAANVITGATLTTSGLQFTTLKIKCLSTATAVTIAIGTTVCE
jgi:hypothetical protein